MSRFIKKGTLEELNSFLTRYYLEEFVAEGRSKIKFVTGSSGSGKSYFLKLSKLDARKLGYVEVSLSAMTTPLYDFKEIYAAVFAKVDLDECLSRCASRVIEGCGYDPKSIPPGTRFLDYLSTIGEADGITRRAIRRELKGMFLDSPVCDNNFALACSMIVSSKLGCPLLDEETVNTLYAWMRGDKELKMSAIRLAGLAPIKINKTNARHMLRSLTEVLKQGGYKGLAIYIDDLDSLLNRSGLDSVRYTKMRREDTYEIIRELIDSIDSMRNIFFVFAFDRALLDDEALGIKSYQALWMRIQNEISGSKFNCFADILDLNRFASFFFDVLVLRAIYDSFFKAHAPEGAEPIISDDELLSIKSKTKDGSCGVLSLLEKEAIHRAKALSGGTDL